MIDLLIIGSNNKETGGIPRYIPEQLKHLPDNVRARVYDIGAPEGQGKLWFGISLFLALFDAAKFPFRQRPDLVHVHTSQMFSFYRAAFYVLFASYVWRIPVFLHIHGSSFDEFVSTKSTVSRKLQSIVYGASSEIIVLSQYWKQQLEPHTDSDKITIIPNAVNPDDYSPEYDVDPPHIIFISNLIERKGVNELTDALDSLIQKDQNVRVSIAGKGPFSEEVEALAAEHESVEYLGYVSEDRKYELLSQGSIYVLPAYAEGLPIAILEAMAGGNAIISTKVGSIPEVITEENGIVIEPENVDDLRNAIDGMLTSPEEVQSKGKTNRRTVKENYSWDVVMKQIVDRYEHQTM